MQYKTNKVLFELLLKLGNSFELNSCVNESLNAYSQQLNCIGAILFLNKSLGDFNETVFVKPKFLRTQEENYQIFNNFLIDCKKAPNKFFKNNLPCLLIKNKTFYYIFKLVNVGYLFLIKRDEKLSKSLMKDLNLINNKFSKKLETCIELKKLKLKDEIILYQSRMASLGEVVESVAHQWTQPLSLISTSASSLKLQTDMGMEVSKNELVDNLKNIILKTKYLSQTISDFKSYFNNDIEKTKFKINKLFKYLSNFLEIRFHKNNIEFILKNECKEDIYSYKNEIVQVGMNLINNSIDALECNKNLNRKVIIVSCRKSNRFLTINIQDNAGGIKKEVLKKIFRNKYITTKQNGTGLGLRIVYQIVTKQIGGSIEVKNKEFELEGKKYKGALFTFSIPIG